ncbi:DUF3291 domain-containing protein [soil metagenome]
MAHHLAQLNVAKLKASLDHPSMAGFVAALDPVNALADDAPGFVWRLQTEAGDATAIRAFDDELMLVNMSVWESVEALGDYAYRSGHLDVMRRRREWVDRVTEAHLCLWWVEAGAIPTVEEAMERLEHFQMHGPTPRAFTFKRRFEPGLEAGRDDDRWLCPA